MADRNDGARLAEAPSKIVLALPVKAGESFVAKRAVAEGYLKHTFGARLAGSFVIEPAKDAASFVAGVSSPFNVVVDDVEALRSGGATAQLLDVMTKRQTKGDEEFGRFLARQAAREEAFGSFMARFAAGENLTRADLERALAEAAAILPRPEPVVLVGDRGHLIIFHGERFESSQKQGRFVVQKFEEAIKASDESRSVLAFKQAIAAAIPLYQQNARFFMEVMAGLRDAYRRLYEAQARFTFDGIPSPQLEGVKTIVTFDGIITGREQSYAGEISEFSSQLERERQRTGANPQFKQVLAVVSPRLASQDRTVSMAEYTATHPAVLGMFDDIRFVATQSLAGLDKEITGAYVAVSNEGMVIDAANVSRTHAILMELDSRSTTFHGVLPVSARLALTDGENPGIIAGLIELGRRLYKYLPMITPYQLVQLLRAANERMRSIGAAA